MAASARAAALSFAMSPCTGALHGRNESKSLSGSCSLTVPSSRGSLASSSSTFAGRIQGLSVSASKLRLKSLGLEVTCGYIPAEHKWMYEGVQKMGPDVWEKTYYPKEADHLAINKKWYVVDASKKKLGRLASAIAWHIRGKNVPEYTPSLDMGSYVIVVNAEKIEVSGNKRTQKLYRRHSGRPGGLKVETFDQLQKRIPERIVEHAVKGMLPKGRLGRQLFTHLKVYKGPSHPHEAQKPEPLPIHDKRCSVVD